MYQNFHQFSRNLPHPSLIASHFQWKYCKHKKWTVVCLLHYCYLYDEDSVLHF